MEERIGTCIDADTEEKTKTERDTWEAIVIDSTPPPHKQTHTCINTSILR